MSDEKFGVKDVVSLAVTGLIELFTGAVINHVVGDTDGGRLAKFGAKAGGVLLGLWIGDKTSDYICEEIDKYYEIAKDIKESIEEESEE